jgi:hypothetical protein
MAKRPLPNGQSDPLAPYDVRVMVLGFPDDGGLLRWLESHRARIPPRLWKVAAAIPIAIVGALVAVAFAVGGGDQRQGVIWGVRQAGPAGVAAAYGYPAACLRVRISAVNPAFARADIDHPRSCGYDIGFPSALFHRFAGEWHPVLYAASYPCPVPAIPMSVQSQLSLCPRHDAR